MCSTRTEEKSEAESPPSPSASDIASDMLSNLCGILPPAAMARRRGVGAAASPRLSAAPSAASSGEEPARDPLMSGEYAGGGESDGSRTGEYAGAPTTETTTGVRPAAAATLAGEEDAAEDAGLSFASAMSMSVAPSCRCRVGVVVAAAVVAAAAAAAAPVAAVAAAAAAVPAAVDFADGAPSCDGGTSSTGGSGGTNGIGEDRRLRGEVSGDRSKESVLGTLEMRATPARLDPTLLVLVVLLVDAGWPLLPRLKGM